MLTRATAGAGGGDPNATGGGDPDATQAPTNPADTLVFDGSRVGNPPTPIRELRLNNQIWGFEKERKLTREEKIFKKQTLEKEIGLNETTSEEII